MDPRNVGMGPRHVIPAYDNQPQSMPQGYEYQNEEIYDYVEDEPMDYQPQYIDAPPRDYGYYQPPIEEIDNPEIFQRFDPNPQEIYHAPPLQTHTQHYKYENDYYNQSPARNFQEAQIPNLVYSQPVEYQVQQPRKQPPMQPVVQNHGNSTFAPPPTKQKKKDYQISTKPEIKVIDSSPAKNGLSIPSGLQVGGSTFQPPPKNGKNGKKDYNVKGLVVGQKQPGIRIEKNQNKRPDQQQQQQQQSQIQGKKILIGQTKNNEIITGKPGKVKEVSTRIPPGTKIETNGAKITVGGQSASFIDQTSGLSISRGKQKPNIEVVKNPPNQTRVHDISPTKTMKNIMLGTKAADEKPIVVQRVKFEEREIVVAQEEKQPKEEKTEKEKKENDNKHVQPVPENKEDAGPKKHEKPKPAKEKKPAKIPREIISEVSECFESDNEEEMPRPRLKEKEKDKDKDKEKEKEKKVVTESDVLKEEGIKHVLQLSADQIKQQQHLFQQQQEMIQQQQEQIKQQQEIIQMQHQAISQKVTPQQIPLFVEVEKPKRDFKVDPNVKAKEVKLPEKKQIQLTNDNTNKIVNDSGFFKVERRKDLHLIVSDISKPKVEEKAEDAEPEKGITIDSGGIKLASGETIVHKTKSFNFDPNEAPGPGVVVFANGQTTGPKIANFDFKPLGENGAFQPPRALSSFAQNTMFKISKDPAVDEDLNVLVPPPESTGNVFQPPVDLNKAEEKTEAKEEEEKKEEQGIQDVAETQKQEEQVPAEFVMPISQFQLHPDQFNQQVSMPGERLSYLQARGPQKPIVDLFQNNDNEEEEEDKKEKSKDNKQKQDKKADSKKSKQNKPVTKLDGSDMKKEQFLEPETFILNKDEKQEEEQKSNSNEAKKEVWPEFGKEEHVITDVPVWSNFLSKSLGADSSSEAEVIPVEEPPKEEEESPSKLVPEKVIYIQQDLSDSGRSLSSDKGLFSSSEISEDDSSGDGIVRRSKKSDTKLVESDDEKKQKKKKKIHMSSVFMVIGICALLAVILGVLSFYILP